MKTEQQLTNIYNTVKEYHEGSLIGGGDLIRFLEWVLEI